ncbi:class I adenylate cyclase, partial [Acidihalobacter sp.]|uniref:class I adenylate cyclase n=1 Tax=Acidihalobacter sp. TaxID=1872108 RepID=UPI00307D85F4
MFTSAAAALATFSDERRLYALEGDGPLAHLQVERWSGHEALSACYVWTVDALSSDAGLSLEAMLGQRAALRTTLADGTRSVRTGLVREAHRNLAALGHTDPFRHGHHQGSLVLSLDHLLLNSWREALVQRYAGHNAVMDTLCHYLKGFPRSSAIVPPVPHVYIVDAALGSAVEERVKGLFQEVIKLFYDPKYGPDTRYVVSVGHSHYVIEMADEVPRYVEHTSQHALMHYLGHTSRQFHRMVFDERSLKETFLPLIYSRNEPDVVQCFYYKGLNGSTEIFVLDEKGALFYQYYADADPEVVLTHFMRFFTAVEKRISFMRHEEIKSQSIIS